ncbi:unnamed protein product, partial [Ranitomeya imitator]
QISKTKTKRGKRGGKLSKKKTNKVTNNPQQVYNLSSHQLSGNEISLLQKGLKFAPTKQAKPFELYISMKKYLRNLALKKYFLKKEHISTNIRLCNTTEYVHTSLANASTFHPIQEYSKAFHSFDMLVSRDIRKYNTKNMQYLPNNLNTQERKAIKDLQTNHNIVVRPADKGGGIVILDHSMYHQESIRLLSDPITYKKLRYDPTTQYIIKLSALAYKGKSKGILDTKEYHYILNKNPSKAVFYHIPKIHKDQTHPPGRPIISGINNLTANLSRYVDVHLQKCMQLIPAYLKDTGHTLEILKEIKWNKKYILGTLDIKSLYTVINQEKGCEAAEYFLGSLGTYTQTQIQYILDCIKFILQHNYFVYEDQHYLQTWGTAMGTRFAPSYANIYVAKWEESYIISEGRLHPGLVTWRRFIDDILFIWDGPRSDLDRFIAGLNSNQYGLEFTPNISTTSINFLDLNIYVDNNQLHTKCHRKEVDSNSFIQITSCHLPVWLANVPKSQYTRIRRNCSNMVDYDREANHLTQQFMDKGYSKPLLEKAQYDVALLPRESLLKKANNSNINNIKEVDLKDQIFNLPIITQYHANHKKFVGIIRKHWAILRQDKIIGDFLPTIPKFIYKKSQSLGQLIAPTTKMIGSNRQRNHTSLATTKTGFSPCGTCFACTHTTFKKDKQSTFSNAYGTSTSDVTARSSGRLVSAIFLFLACIQGRYRPGRLWLCTAHISSVLSAALERLGNPARRPYPSCGQSISSILPAV